MANGFTPVDNELLEAIARTYFSPAENKIFWALFRQTAGWSKETDRISFSQFAKWTNIDRRHVLTPIKRLIKRKMIICENAGNRRICSYGIQKEYTQWVTNPINMEKRISNLPPKIESTVTESSGSLSPKDVTDNKTNLSPKQGTTDTSLGQADTSLGDKSVTESSANKRKKETITKEIIQKKTRGDAPDDKKQDKEIYVLPEYINDDTWNAFLDMRKKIKKPPTAYAINLILKKLKTFFDQGEDVNKILEKSILNSWQDVFSLKNGGNYAGTGKNFNARELPGKYTRPEDA